MDTYATIPWAELHDDATRAKRETRPGGNSASGAMDLWWQVSDYLARNPDRSERQACERLGIRWSRYVDARSRVVSCNAEAMGAREHWGMATGHPIGRSGRLREKG